MKVLVVNINDELKDVSTNLNELKDLKIIEVKNDKELQSAIKETKYDVAILMPEAKCGGINSGRKLLKANPDCNIIFISESKDLAYDAFECRPSGYLVKPVSVSDLRNEFANLRVSFPVRKLKVVTFGEFEVYDSDDNKIKFKRKVSKEILAYLIDKNGREVATRDICEEVLKREYDIQSSKFISQYTRDLKNNLEEAGYHDVFGKNGHNFFVDSTQLDCDYYKLLAGDREAIKSFNDEYMLGYDWAEETRDELCDYL